VVFISGSFRYGWLWHLGVGMRRSRAGHFLRPAWTQQGTPRLLKRRCTRCRGRRRSSLLERLRRYIVPKEAVSHQARWRSGSRWNRRSADAPGRLYAAGMGRPVERKRCALPGRSAASAVAAGTGSCGPQFPGRGSGWRDTSTGKWRWRKVFGRVRCLDRAGRGPAVDRRKAGANGKLPCTKELPDADATLGKFGSRAHGKIASRGCNGQIRRDPISEWWYRLVHARPGGRRLDRR